MKIKQLVIIAILLFACNNTKVETTEFDNSVCDDFVNQSGYPVAICDCVKENVLQLQSSISEVTYQDIEQLVNQCVQTNLGIGY